MKKLLAILLLALFIQPSFSQETAVQKDIKELLVLTGSAKLGIQVAAQMISSFKQIYPDVPSKFWDEFLKGIKEEDLINLTVPIYEKFYTQNEIRELIKFYKTPVGKKTIEILPRLTRESMLAGQEWGEKIGEKVAEKLMEEGYIKQ